MATKVTAGVQVNYLRNGDSLNTSLLSTGALYQIYKKGTNEFSPNWATIADAQRPIIFPRVYSTMQAQEVSVNNIVWKYNNAIMTFDGSGKATAPSIAVNKLQKVTYQGKEALKMIGNVASETNNDSDTIGFTGTVTASGQTVQVSAETTLLIEEASANLYRLFLIMVDDVIDGDETSVTMTAEVYNIGSKVTTGVQYEFLKLDGTVLRAKGSSASFAVTRAMIDSELMVVCKAYIGNVVVAQEQKQVWDSTDPYTIICDKGTEVAITDSENVTFGFSLMNTRNGNTVSGVIFDIKVYKNSDSSDITSQFSPSNTSVTLTGTKMATLDSVYILASCEI